MSTPHFEAVAQSRVLELKSNENLVMFFERELRAVDEGRKATELLNGSIIRNLVRFGILESAKWRGCGSKYLVLTDKGRDLRESHAGA